MKKIDFEKYFQHFFLNFFFENQIFWNPKNFKSRKFWKIENFEKPKNRKFRKIKKKWKPENRKVWKSKFLHDKIIFCVFFSCQDTIISDNCPSTNQRFAAGVGTTRVVIYQWPRRVVCPDGWNIFSDHQKIGTSRVACVGLHSMISVWIDPVVSDRFLFSLGVPLLLWWLQQDVYTLLLSIEGNST